MMADKIYRLTFAKDDGTEESVEFTSPQGPKGDTGPKGVGIVSITLKEELETGNVYTVLLSDGSSHEFVAPAGPAGSGGGEGDVPGADGGYYTPSVTQVDDNTIRLSFTPSEGDMPAVDDVEVSLPKGPIGPVGPKGDPGESPTVSEYDAGDDYTTVAFSDGSVIQIPNGVGILNIRLQTEEDTGNTYRVELTNGQEYTFVAPAGPSGKSGGDGVGIELIKLVEEAASGNTYSVYLTDGTSYDIVAPAGSQGIQGIQGTQGPAGEEGVGIAEITLKNITEEGYVYTVRLSDYTSYEIVAPAGPQGVQGIQGPVGATGSYGNDGVGIQAVDYDADSGDFVIMYTDHRHVSIPGPEIPPGSPGDAGVGVESISVNQSNGRWLFTMTDGSTKEVIGPGNSVYGHGWGTCGTAASSTIKQVSLSSGYLMSNGGIVVVQFLYDVPAGAALNVNSQGTKYIRHEGGQIKDGVIKAGDTATFMYNGTNYILLSVARSIPTNVSQLENDAKYATEDQLGALSAEKVTRPSTATVGQVIAVKAVDADGKPTEWEAVDMASGGGASSWNDLTDKPFHVASLDFETFALDMPPEEIGAVIEAGGSVLFAMTMTPLAVEFDTTGLTGVYANLLSAYPIEGIIISTVYIFSPTDGTFMGTHRAMWTGGTVLE